MFLLIAIHFCFFSYSFSSARKGYCRMKLMSIRKSWVVHIHLISTFSGEGDSGRLLGHFLPMQLAALFLWGQRCRLGNGVNFLDFFVITRRHEVRFGRKLDTWKLPASRTFLNPSGPKKPQENQFVWNQHFNKTNKSKDYEHLSVTFTTLASLSFWAYRTHTNLLYTYQTHISKSI